MIGRRRSLRFRIASAATALCALGGLLGGGGCAGGEGEAAGRDVLLVTVDTLRRDHLGTYGNPDVRTPALDRLARGGAVAELAVAPFGRTTQAFGSIHTGLHPLRHGADFLGATLPARVATLGERFAELGRATAAFVANRNLEAGLGFDQGFDEYVNRDEWWAGNPGQRVVEETLAWLGGRRGGGAPREAAARPLFLWVHLLEPHWPYTPRPPVAFARAPREGGRRLFERGLPSGVKRGQVVFEADRHLDPRDVSYARALYAGDVEEADLALVRLFRGLEAMGILDEAVLLFTSDHGESLGEHRYWFSHGQYAYEASLAVPLIVRAPGAVPPGSLVRGTVRLEDVAPTLLDLAGGPTPEDAADLDGTSVARAFRAGRAARVGAASGLHLTDHTRVSSLNPRQTVDGRAGRWWVWREDDWKLFRIPVAGGDPVEELYDLATDPGETRDLLAARPDVADRLRERLLAARLAWAEESTDAAPAEPESLDAARLEALRSLGYID